MTYSKFLLPLLILSTSVSAQYRINLNNFSSNYDVRINVENCSNTECNGRASIDLVNKSTKRVQTFTSSNLEFYLGNQQTPTKDYATSFDSDFSGESPLIIDDFNFDGIQDLAIRNGSRGKNGAPSYDVYVYNSAQKKFVPDAELTNLASNHSGLFEVDPERKRLIIYTKSGNLKHCTTEYTFMPTRGVIKVYEVEEDETDGERVKVSKSEFIDDKWITTIKDYPADQYYKK